MLFRDLLDFGAQNWRWLVIAIPASLAFIAAFIFVSTKNSSDKKAGSQATDKQSLESKPEASHSEDKKPDDSEPNHEKLPRFVLIATMVLIISLVLYVILVIGTFVEHFHQRGLQPDFDKWGQVGDYFGGMLNPILAFASFIALLYTIRIQSEELRLTREEFAKSVEAQKDVVVEHKNNLMQNKVNSKVSIVADILRAKIKEADELLLKLEGDPSSFVVAPSIISMYKHAYTSAESIPSLPYEAQLKNCSSVEEKFKKIIGNESQTYNKGFDLSLYSLHRITNTADYYLQQLSDDTSIDPFYLSALQVEFQRPAAILFLAGKVSWNCYRNISMSPFMDGQGIGGYPNS
jgi:uncharacterized membrane protein